MLQKPLEGVPAEKMNRETGLDHATNNVGQINISAGNVLRINAIDEANQPRMSRGRFSWRWRIHQTSGVCRLAKVGLLRSTFKFFCSVKACNACKKRPNPLNFPATV